MTRTVCVLALVAVGCGPMTNPKLQNDAKQLAMSYHNYHDSFQKGPADDKAFLEYAMKSGDKNLQLLIQDAQRGEWTIYYGVKLISLTAGTENTVLIYHKDVPKSGGVVAMADGSVRNMTADEFAKATKAGK